MMILLEIIISSDRFNLWLWYLYTLSEEEEPIKDVIKKLAKKRDERMIKETKESRNYSDKIKDSEHEEKNGEKGKVR